MSQSFYIGGFLYIPQAQEILLQHLGSDEEKSYQWDIFSVISDETANPQKVFQQKMHKALGIRFPMNMIHPVYDYFHADSKKTRHLFYIAIEDKKKLRFKKQHTYSWVTFKQITKMHIDNQTKQDLIVSQRVILAKVRSTEAATLPVIA